MLGYQKLIGSFWNKQLVCSLKNWLTKSKKLQTRTGTNIQDWTKSNLCKTVFKKFEGMVCLPYTLKLLKDCLPYILPGPFLNALSNLSKTVSRETSMWFKEGNKKSKTFKCFELVSWTCGYYENLSQ